MRFFFILFFLLIELILSAQPKSDFSTPIKIGDKVPNVSLGGMISSGGVINPISDSLKVNDFAGKLLILDFWTSNCGSCIREFPNLEDLQSKFKDDVVFLSVGFTQKNSNGTFNGDIQPLIKKWIAAGKQIRVPVTRVVESFTNPQPNDLRSLFPFNSVPTVVWIDKQGLLKAVTGKESLTVKNIQNVLDGKNVKLRPKPVQVNPDEFKPFILNQPFATNFAKVIGSAFSGYVDSLNTVLLRRDFWRDSIMHFYAVNSSVYGLYLRAYAELYPETANWLNKKKIIVESKGKIFYKDLASLTEKDEWEMDKILKRDYYSYELIVPVQETTEKECYQRMINDFDQFFKIKSSLSTKKIRCLDLVRTDTTKIFKLGKKNCNPDYSSGDDFTFDDSGRSYTTFYSISAKYLVDQLNVQFPSAPYIFDQTGITNEFDITLPVKFKSLEDLQKVLNKSGLKLIENERTVKVLVLKNVKTK